MKHFAKNAIKFTVVAAAALAAASTVQAQNITGAGASFPAPVYAAWADAYKTEAGVSLNYQSIGSGGGVKQIQAKTVTFGASDAPLKAEDLDKAGLIQFPTVIGGVVPVINVEGIESGKLTLDGETLANIYLGEVKTWNDPAIAKLNPDAKLPSTAIAVVRRSDGSGTNFLFTDYLSKVNAKFKEEVGAATAVEWPVGLGAKGNEGVSNTVKQTQGAIGYVEYAYAKQNKLPHANMVNSAGKAVEPTAAAFEAAAANADWANAPGNYLILTNQPGDASWPITGATFILMHKQPQDAKASADALKFFDWGYGAKGDEIAAGLDYVALPDQVVEGIRTLWKNEIKADGKSVYGQ
ncbi:phosphate ABC transporter substrate-binding protein PstS [Terrihabitans sp. B22-R8]|uniref:phosphate ABC transporter substrate-binding protein PstS n=1 Tax=Terrihabitans sp. B22-R8 TaxID=3425128 RepID=UPI00403C31E5